MITRIYRVRIHSNLRSAFEPLFKTVAVQSVSGFAGCTRVTIGWPTEGTPNEYAMISEWEDEAGLREFAGDDWTVAHIPEEMEKFVKRCWVHHYVGIPA
ncbi:MAG: antibiotic biosynthesis monooxygenase [Pseudomonadota bacterium]|nr:antibiotic biosynthesis monooxygenase [Pseudomonadota bacterium]MEE3069814.1 antibiotic biosynthesis monooxygenase [Pseudomonadota bacterium]